MTAAPHRELRDTIMPDKTMPDAVSNDPISHRRALLAIAGVWAGWLGVLALLGLLGLGTGLSVWPMGEDRNWIGLLRLGSAGETARGFWQIDHRNPLSPWWYIAFRRLILAWPYGLFMLRNLVGLALAMSAYALIATWLGARARAFAATIGCLIAIFTFNAFFDQIYWNFQAALACSILCVVCYLNHRRRPASGQWLAAALVLWLVAIATYTIQTGAVVAIAFAAWTLRERHSGRGPIAGLAAGLRDVAAATWPFGAVLVLFILIWQTTSVPTETFVGTPGIGRLFESLATGLWHPDSTLMGQILAHSPHRLAFGLVGLLVFALVVAALRGPVMPAVGMGALAGLVLLAGCLTVPTLFVETLGTQWPPGSRWRMIYQFTTPVFDLALLGIAALALARALGRTAWRWGVALCFGLAALGSLAHNERQVLLTRNERALRATILRDAIEQARFQRTDLHYLVLLDNLTRWFAVDQLSPVYARTWFPRLQASFRLVPGSIYEPLQAGPPVAFLDDEAGVANATVDGSTLPYARIRIVMARQGLFSIVEHLQESDLAGLRATWRRTGPVTLGR